jgi:hypothetical protein
MCLEKVLNKYIHFAVFVEAKNHHLQAFVAVRVRTLTQAAAAALASMPRWMLYLIGLG